jgi:hypothetical protein
MRSSVHNLIQFGITTPGGSTATAGDAEGSSLGHAPEIDLLGESLSFDTLLALAASLHRPSTTPLLEAAFPAIGAGSIVESPGDEPRSIAGRKPLALFEAPLAGMFDSDTRSDHHTNIHELFTGLTSTSSSSEPVQEIPTLKKHQAMDQTLATDFRYSAGDGSLPIVFRPGRRVIPIHVDRPAEAPETARPPRETAQTPALQPAPAEQPSAGLVLRIVARNDALDMPATGDALPITRRLPDLRLVVSNDRPADGALNTDLLDRLARGWRQSFADEPVEPAGIETALPRSSEPAADGAHSEHDATSRFSKETNIEIEPRRTGGRPAAPVVPLFSELVSASALPQQFAADVETVDVQQAVNEVPREVLRLERMGGSELSFSMRLHPEHLGQIDIEIQRGSDGWTVAITTADEGARHALAAEMHRLESAFRDHNLALDRLTIVARSPEPVINAPEQAGQTANPDWNGAGTQDFMGNQKQDDRGWHGYGLQRIIGIDSSRDVGGEQEVTASHNEMSRSGIDIHI